MFRYILLLLALLPVTAHAATVWTIDPVKSSLSFTGTQQGAPFDGKFTRFSGTIQFDPSNPKAGSADIAVDIKTVSTNSPDRDQYLPQDNWFSVTKFPQAHYAVQSFEASGNDQFIAHGQLKIRDKTLPLNLPFTLKIDGKTAHAQGQVQVKRLDYGIGQGEWKDTSTVGDAVTVKIDVTAQQK